MFGIEYAQLIDDVVPLAAANGAMTSGEFVVHGYLREVAAGGHPWG
jgi:hypothetical protein